MKNMMRKNLYVMLFLYAWLVPISGSAAPVNLAQIKQALAELPAMSGRFEQIDWRGARVGGTFFLALPSRAKFIYDAPTSAVITLRGNWLVVQDTPGGEANRFPVGGSPLKLLRDKAQSLTAKHIAALRQGKDAEVGDAVEIELTDPEGKLAGSLAVQFSLPDWQLRGWWVRDVQGLVTQTQLLDIVYHEALPEKLFFIDEDEADE